MAGISQIEWTDRSWNPVRGCRRISPGCEHCYAESMAHRFSGEGRPYEGLTRKTSRGPVWTGEAMLVDHDLEAPLRWRVPQRIFVNSMSDLFFERVPAEYIARCFDVMARAQRHQFQILSKRAERMAEVTSSMTLPPNAWLGVSVESADYVSRIDHLRRVPAAIRFLSVEPLLGPILDLDLTDIHWVIVGGESGRGARSMDPDWVRSIRDQCVAAGVPFFFKQWGGTRKKETGRVLDGRTWDEFPVEIHRGRALPVVS